ncbi:hypothetical protein V2J09_003405 [Rumex salicifolius]
MDPAPSSQATVSSPTSSSASSGGGAGSKIRLLCSYGGRIVPRPHDKALFYAGGESRLLAVDRRTATASLAALTSHISRSLLNGRPFSLKYQLPDHDLDSLVSVATDEDLVNMIEEYDRAALSPNPTRLRFFLFPPAAKAESSSLAAAASAAAGEYDPKSEAWFFDALRSAGIAVDGKRTSESESGGEGMVESEGTKSVDSGVGPTPMNSEWAGSTPSAPASLPAIKVCGGDEIGGSGQDLRAASYSLVDSPESDSSATSPNFKSPTLVYLDSLSHSDPKDSKLFTTPMETDLGPSEFSPLTDQLNSIPTYGYSFSQPMDQMQHQLHSQPQPTLQSYQQLQPQYIHAPPQYVPQFYSTTVPAASYSTTYQPYLQQQQQAAYQMNKPYPVYLMQQAPPQCDFSLPSSHPQLLSKPNMMVASSVGLGLAKPAEITAKVYRAGPTVSQPISVPSAQMGQAQQPVSVSSALDAASFGGAAEFDDPLLHAQIYKTQPPRQTAATAMLLDNLTQLQLDSTK